MAPWGPPAPFAAQSPLMTRYRPSSGRNRAHCRCTYTVCLTDSPTITFAFVLISASISRKWYTLRDDPTCVTC